MLQSLLVYSSLMLVMLLFALYTSKHNTYINSHGLVVHKSFWKFDVIFPLILFAVIFGMRYDVGFDHLGYLRNYLNKEFVGKNDILFNVLSIVGWSLNWHYVIYFTVIAFIQVFFFFYAFKDERYLYPLLVFLFFVNFEWDFWMNGIRQSLALCVWIYSIKFIYNKKFWLYLFWGIIAFLFHKSALILILFYPILRNGKDYFKSISLQLILLIGAFVFNLLFSDLIYRIEPIINSYAFLLGNIYSSYDIELLMNSTKAAESEGLGLVYFFKIILNVTIILYSNKLKSFYGSKRFIIIYFFFFIGLLTMYMFPLDLVSFTRPFRYFYIFKSIMYAYFLYYLWKTKYKYSRYGMFHAMMFYGLIVIFVVLYFYSITNAGEESSFHYQFYFDQNLIGYPTRLFN